MKSRSLRPVWALLLVLLTWPAQAQDSGASVVKTTLPNGLRILCRREKTPLVALDVFVRNSVAGETRQTAGRSAFVARALLASTASLSPDALDQQIGALGGNVAARWQPDWTQVTALTVRDRFNDAADLVSDVLKNAAFDPAAVEDARGQMLSDLDDRDSDPYQTAYVALRSRLYAGSGYQFPAQGTRWSVKHLTRGDLLAYYRRCYVPQNMVVVCVGDVDPAAAAERFRQALSDFPAGRAGLPADLAPKPPLTFLPDPTPSRVYQPGLPEVAVMVGVPVPPVTSPQYPALLVANAVLGGMKSSRMFTAVRSEKGLAYQIGSAYSPQLAASDLTGFGFGAPTKIDPTTKKPVSTVGLLKDELLKQFEGLKAQPPTAEELARAQHYLIGSYAIRHERIEDRAYWLGFAEIARGDYHWDTDYAKYISGVTAGDVQQIAQTYFVRPSVAVVGPSSGEDAPE